MKVIKNCANYYKFNYQIKSILDINQDFLSFLISLKPKTQIKSIKFLK